MPPPRRDDRKVPMDPSGRPLSARTASPEAVALAARLLASPMVRAVIGGTGLDALRNIDESSGPRSYDPAMFKPANTLGGPRR